MEPLIAAPTGKVAEIVGHAIVLLPDGSSRVLHVGDVLHPGERILTTQNGIVRIEDAHAAPGSTLPGAQIQIAGSDNGLAHAGPTAHTASHPAAHDNKAADQHTESNGVLDRVIKHINADDPQDAPAAGLQPGAGTGGLTPGLRVGRVSESVDAQHFDFAPATHPAADASAPQTVQVTPGPQPPDVPPPPPAHYTPQAVADTATLDQNTPLNVTAASGVLSNDSDSVAGTPLSIVGVAAGTPSVAPTSGVGSTIHGVMGDLVLHTDGSYSYVPGAAARALGAGASAVDTFTYAVSDGHGGTSSATLAFTVTGTNDAPTAAANTGALSQDATLTTSAATGVLNNATDPDTGDVLAVSGVAPGAGTPLATALSTSIAGALGHLTLNADGSYSYVADNAKSLGVGATGTDTFTYSISDGHGGTSSATLTFTVTGTNGAPTAVADTGALNQAGTLTKTAATGVLSNDSDPDTGDILTVAGVAAGTGAPSAAAVGNSIAGALGHLTLNADGSYSYVADNAKSLGVGATATDTFTYSISDGHGGTSSTTLTFTVTGTNDAPTAIADTGSLNQDATLAKTAVTGVLSNDTDPDTGDILTVAGVAAGTGVPSATGVGSSIAGSLGHLTLNADGSYSYVADNAKSLGVGATATDTFTYSISDGHGGTSSTTLTFTVTGTNDAPTAVADTGALNQDATLTKSAATGILINDSDPDTGDILTVAGVAAGTGAPSAAAVGNSIAGSLGHLTLNADGSYSYVADNAKSLGAGVTATDTFTYSISDGHGGTSSATIAFTVTGTNDAPTAHDDYALTPINASLGNINVLSNDSDPDLGDVLSVSSASVVNPALGSVSVNPDGTLNFTPALNISGPVEIDYTVTDGHGGSASAKLIVTVSNNHPPVASADTAFTDQNTSLNVSAASGVLANDSDPDAGAVLSVIGVAAGTSGGTPTSGVASAVHGAYGDLTLQSDGSYSYTPSAAAKSLPAGSNATDTFTYAVSDGQGGVSSTTLTFTVTGTNDAPTAVADTGSITQDSTLAKSAATGVLINDSDPDTGDILTVAGVAAGAGVPAAAAVGNSIAGSLGHLTLNADGSYSYVADNAKSLGVGATATDTFTYSISDGHGGTSSTTLTFTVTGTNDAPTAVADTGALSQNATLTKSAATGVLVNDTDPDTGDILTVAGVAAGTGVPSAASVGSSIAGSLGHLTLNADGSYSYVADNAKSLGVGATATDTFTYSISDGHGGTSSTTLTFTVTGTNDAPTAVADTGALNQDATLAKTAVTGVLSNDSDPDTGDILTVAGVAAGTGAPSAAAVGNSIAGALGHLTLNADGSYSYVADNAKSLGVGATATDTFTYSISDGHGGTSSTTLTFTVTGTNDAPTAVADTGALSQAGTLAKTAVTGVLSNDSDPDTGDILTVAGVAAGTGVPAAAAVGNSIAGTLGHLTLNADGSYSYVADNAKSLGAGATATDTFTYSISDGHGGTSSTTLTFTVTGTNDAPTAVADTGALNQDATLTKSAATGILINDSDPDTGDILTVAGVAAGTGAPSAAAVGNSIAGALGHLILNADGSYSYVADNAKSLGVGATATDTFTYSVSDGHGGTSSTTLTFTVTGANDAPTAVADTGALSQAGTLTKTAVTGVLSNDTDPDTGDVLTVAGVAAGTGAPSAAAVGNSIAGTLGHLTLNADGSYSYVADNAKSLGVGATATDTFTYSISDGHGGTSSTTLTFTVTGANDAPTAVADTGALSQAGTLTKTAVTGVLSNDTDPDTGDVLTVAGVAAGTGAPSAAAVGASIAGALGHLTLNADGSYSYVADNAKSLGVGATATDTFTYSISDGHGGTSSTTLTFTVTGTNDAPTAVADTGALSQNATLAKTSATGVLSNDSDPDTGDILTVAGVAAGTGAPSAAAVGASVAGSLGHLTLNADGSYSYVADNAKSLGLGATATDTFTYSISDGHGGTSSTTLTFTVTGTNDAPTAVADTGALSQNATLTKSAATGVLINDTDPDTGDILAVAGVAAGTGAPSAAAVGNSIAGVLGHLTLNADGSYSYVADNAKSLGAGVTATDTFTYSISDGHGGTSSTTLTFTVTGTNDAPTAVADTGALSQAGTLTKSAVTGVLSNDSDPDTGDILTVAGVAAGTGVPAASAVGSSIAGSLGHLTLNADGSYSYVADNAKSLGVGATATDTFTYSISDGHGGTSSTTLTFTVTGTNDAPTAVADTGALSQAGTLTKAATSGVLSNDSDPDTGDILTVAGVAAGTGVPAASAVGSSIAGSLGHLTLNADGSYSYVADNAKSLGVGATATDTFTYSISDGHGGTSSTTLTFTVTGTNDAPTAVADTGALSQAGTLTKSAVTGVLSNDSDPDTGDILTVAGVAAGTGAPSAAAVANSIAGALGHLTLNADGSYSYVADNAKSLGVGATATDTFTYSISDGHGGTSSTTLTFTVTGTNDAPTAVADTGALNQDATLAKTAVTGVLSNDSDPDTGDILTVAGVAAGTGAPSAAAVGNSIAGALGHLTLNADGSYSYVADNAKSLGVGATATDTFTYSISDGHGGTSSTTLTFTVTGTNDAPTAVADTGALSQAGTLAKTAVTGVLSNDTDPDTGDILTVAGVAAGTGVPAASAVGNSIAGSLGHLTLNADGSYSYVADNAKSLGVGATATDTFTYSISDGHGGTSSTTLTFTVTGTNDAPTAVADTGALNQDATLTKTAATGVLINDTDPDTGDVLSVAGVAAGTGVPSAAAVGHSIAGSLGHLTLNADGSYSYVADNAKSLGVGATATDTFTYSISDGHGGTSSTTLTFTVTGTNDAPTAVADTGALSQNATLAKTSATGVLSNDSDPDTGDILTVAGVAAGTGAPSAAAVGHSIAGSLGHLTLNADGSYSYAADNAKSLGVGATATDTFTYSISDGHGGTSSTTLTFTVTGTNDAPTAVADTGALSQNATLAKTAATGVLSNDSDPDTGDILTVAGVAAGTGAPSAVAVGNSIAGSLGHLTLNADGSYSYVADNAKSLGVGVTATDTFTYSISDGHGGTSSTTLTFTVTGTNDAPTAVADTGALSQNATLAKTAIAGVLGNDSDPDTGDILTVSGVAAGTGAPSAAAVGNSIAGSLGHLTLNADGSYSYVADNAKSLGAGATATDTFTYSISDGHGGTSSTTLTFTVTGTNDAPTAVADTGALSQAGTLTKSAATGVLINDTDPDTGDILTVSGVAAGTGSPSASALGTAIAGTLGHLTLNADGSYSYVADNAKSLGVGATATDTFTYSISDGHGGTASTTLTFTVTGTNDAPTAVADTGALSQAGTLTKTAVTGVLSNDSDPDTGDILTVAGVAAGTGAPSAAALGTAIAGTLGHLTLNADGSYSYVADNAKSLGLGATATDTFTYAISDGHGGTSSTTLTFTVTGTNDAPTAVADTGALSQNATLTKSAATGVLINDTDPDTGDILTVAGVAAGTGAPSAAAVGASIAGSLGHLTLNADGSYSYVADNAKSLGAGATATDTFTYSISDGHGGTSSTTLTFTVTGTNDAPTAVADTGALSQAGTLTKSAATGVLINDTDPDTGDILTVAGVAAGTGVPAASAVGNSIAGSLGHLTLNADGSYSYVADNAKSLGVGATATDTFTYSISDGHGGTSSTTLTFTVTGTNDAPTAVADTGALNQDATLTKTAATGVLINDTDPDIGDILTVAGVAAGTGAPSAAAVGNSIAGALGHLTLNANGSYSYVADNAKSLGLGATATDTFTYAISDGHGGTSSTTLTFTVTGTNDAPTAVADTGALSQNATLAKTAATGVLSNDSDPDTGDILTVAGVAAGTGVPAASAVGSSIAGSLGHLTLNADGSYSYVADNAKSLGVGATATDTFTYSISDGHGGTSSTTLTFTVTGTNDAPTAVADTGALSQNATLAKTAATGVLSNDSDPDTGDILTVAGVAAGTGVPVASAVGNSIAGSLGHLTLNADGSYSYVADNAKSLGAGVTATDTFTYSISDGHGGTSSTTLTFTVTGTNDAPTAVADTGALSQNATLTKSAATGVLINDTDPDTGDILTVAGVAAGTGAPSAAAVGNSIAGALGHLTLNADGSYSYVADNAKSLGAGATATDTFTYSISDGHGGTSSTTLTFTVTGTNDAPTAVADTGALSQAGTLTKSAVTGVLSNDSDPDTGDILTVAGVAAGTGVPAASAVGNSIAGSLGHLTLNADGSYSYVADNAKSLGVGATATDTFTYSISDGHGGTSSTTLTFTVTGTNDAPTAVADTGTLSQNATLAKTAATGVLSNDSDPDTGDILTVAGVAAGAGVPVASAVGNTIAGALGHLTLNADGSYSYVADNAKSLGVGATATDTFTYSISDGHGGTSSTTLKFTVTGTNDAPTAVADNVTTDQNTTLAASAANGVLKNDSDPDIGDVLTVTGVALGAGAPSSANVGSTLAGTYGSLVLNADGSYTYTPSAADKSMPAGTTGTDTFTYAISDGHGGTASSTLTVTVQGLNDAPVAQPDTATTIASTPISVAASSGVLINDTDIDTGDMGHLVVGGVAAGLAAFTPTAGVSTAVSGTYGTLVLNADGSYTYTPNGTAQALSPDQMVQDTFTYTVKDPGGATSTSTLAVTVDGIVHAPNLSVAAANATYSDGLIHETWNAAVGPFNGGSGVSPTTMQTTIDGWVSAGTPPASTDVLTTIAEPSVTAGVASLTSGLIYLTGGHTYKFSATADDSLLLNVGNSNVLTDTWGTKSGATVTGNFTASTSGWYTIAVYHDNESGPGNFSLSLSDNGGPTLALNSTNFELVQSLADLNSAGIRTSSLVGGTTAEPNYGYYTQLQLDEGPAGNWVPLSKVSASLADTGASETLSVHISGLTAGTELTDGTHWATAGSSGDIDISSWSLNNLSALAPLDFTGTENTIITATATDTLTGVSASTSQSLGLTFDSYNVINATSTVFTTNGTGGNDEMIGSAGNNKISAGAGNDVLIGGAGNDTLTGGAGADVFRWDFADKGAAGTPAKDTITDFSLAAPKDGGDVLDLRDLLHGGLQGSDGSAGNLTHYIDFDTSVSGQTTVHISSTGGFTSGYTAGAEDQTIVLQGINIRTGLGLSSSASDAQVIQQLLHMNKLITDTP